MASQSDESPMGAFLESLQKTKQASKSAPGSPPTPMSLLDFLAAGPRLVSELQKESGMEFSDFAAALNNLVNARFVTLSGPPSEETATLTESGAALIAMQS